MPGSTGPIFLWVIGGDWRKVPGNNKCRHLFKMASTAAIFGFHWLSDKRLSRQVWFFVAYWGWVEEGSFRWTAPPLIQDGRCSSRLVFGSHQLSDECLGQLVRLFCGLLGVTGGRFLSMISAAAHSRWQPSWIWFLPIIWWTPVDWSDFWGLRGYARFAMLFLLICSRTGGCDGVKCTIAPVLIVVILCRFDKYCWSLHLPIFGVKNKP
jgi:hypothetical protein